MWCGAVWEHAAFCIATAFLMCGVVHPAQLSAHRRAAVVDAVIWPLSLSLSAPSSSRSPSPHPPPPTHTPTNTPTHTHQGYLAPAMVNYLSLLGWNDGSEKEIYT